MDKLLQVCAVIDAQGFTVDKVFHPREVSIISDQFKQSRLLNTGLSYKIMTAKDRRANNYVSNNLLGLSFGNTNNYGLNWFIDDANQVISAMYGSAKTENRQYVAIKNHQMITTLEKCSIPYINLEDFGCPKMDLLKLIYDTKYCNFHDREVPNEDLLICAEQKVVCLWKWINDYIKIKSQ